MITTSRREGFGMVFLEPWLFGKPVVGRNLPGVTRDFLDSGLILNHLYSSLPVDEKGSDFASLPPPAQRDRIRQLLASRQAAQSLPAMQAAAAALFAEVSESEIEHNRNVVETGYSIHSYGRKLRRVYRALSGGR
jgi:glycosyltransferase involved in cell wall biosynthesis